MILGLNGRFLAAPPTGVQRFAGEIARRLWPVLHAQGGVAVLLLPRGAAPPADLPRGVRVVEGRLAGHAWERLELPRLAAAARCHVVLHPANTLPSAGGPHVVVVHDVEPLVRPEAFAPAFAAWYRWAVAPAVRRAARVVTTSHAAADEITRVLRIPRTRIAVADQGAAPHDAPAVPSAVDEVRLRLGIDGAFLLAVGGGDPRKNVPFVRAVLTRWRERRASGEALPPDPALVTVTGGRAEVFGRPDVLPLSGEIALARVDDATLRALYTGALALAFPSLGEGFGRPPLESMACGTPAVVGPYAAASEVLGDAAERVELVPDAWVDALARIAAEPEALRAERVARGRVRAAEHSWERGADTVLRVCRDAAGGVGAISVDVPRPARPARDPSGRFAGLRVAIVHDWLTGMRGGERVLEELLGVFPDAELFTLLHVPGTVSRVIEDRPVHTSFVQRLPAAAGRYRWYLPLFPRAIEGFRFDRFDLVLSSSHCVAKGAVVGDVPHLCYCHTPMRYVWDQFDAYFGGASRAFRVAIGPAVASLRRWDRASADRVHRYVANSAHVRDRIRTVYGRDARVIHPPVDVARFAPAERREDFYLVVSALVAYKRVDIAIAALGRLGRRLLVVGSGPERARLEALAGPETSFTGWVEDREVAELMARCRALIMPGVEDFGIVPVEAQAAGAPVIALGSGGALETVVGEGPRATGVLFAQPTPEALEEAVLRFERTRFDPDALRENALRFRPERFREAMIEAVGGLLAERGGHGPVRADQPVAAASSR